MAQPGAPLDLGQRELDVPERYRGDGDEPVGGGRSPVAEKIVVGGHALGHHLPVAKPQEVAVAEPAHVGIQDLGPDALAVHEFQPGVGVVHGRGDLVVGLGDLQRHETVEPGHRVIARRPQRLPVHHPGVPPVHPLNMGHLVVQTGWHPRRPHIRRLGQVGVHVDHLEPLKQISAHGVAFLLWALRRRVGCRGRRLGGRGLVLGRGRFRRRRAGCRRGYRGTPAGGRRSGGRRFRPAGRPGAGCRRLPG